MRASERPFRRNVSSRTEMLLKGEAFQTAAVILRPTANLNSLLLHVYCKNIA